MTITPIKNWYSETVKGVDTLEFEQAALRLVLSLAFVTYYSVHLLNAQIINPVELQTFYYVICFIVIAISIMASIVIQKNKSIARRLLGTWLDIGSTTLSMYLTADISVVLIGVYLWVTFGNGFRYGNNYLYHSQVLSLIGFAIVMQYGPYWKTHLTAGYGMFIMLIFLPLYVAKLIHRLNEATHKAEIAREKAAEASLAKTQFVANMSHEIRTPLNGIIGISTLFKTTPLNADQKDLLKTLDSSSKLLLSLLNNVLDFTKIEERKFTVEHIDFSAEEAVRDTLEIFRSQAAAKGIQVGISISDALHAVKGDAFVIRQVLANLMGNAIKFTEKGSVTLSAIALQDSDTHITVRFEVADTGVGIPLNKQHKIFDSFTQADSSTTRKFGGSGLGLTIAKHMVEAMGGDLQFQSTEGVGSRFWFTLSLEKVVNVPVDAPESVSSKPDAHSESPASAIIQKIAQAAVLTSTATKKPNANLPNPNKLNILVCEDESTNQKIITRLLSLPGHQVQIAENSDEMLDALEVRKFDLVITDLNMSGMNGADALKLYRFTNPDDKDTRFILFTADATATARETAAEAGFDGFLTKPIEAATLFNAIESILNLPANTADLWLHNALNTPVEIESDLAEDNIALDIHTLKELEKIGAGDDLFMHRLLRNYLSDSIKLIYKIETAVKQKHYGELHDLCHALKGNSLSVGATKLAGTTELISKLTRSVNPAQSIEMLDILNSDFSTLTLAVEDYLRRPLGKTTEVGANTNSR